MSQTTISQYFTSRKRPAADGEKIVNQSNKVLIVETGSSANSSDVEIFARKTEVTHLFKTVTPHDPKKTIKFNSAKLSAKKSRVKSAEKSAAKRRLFRAGAADNHVRNSVKQKHELLREVIGQGAGRASSPSPSPLPPGSPLPPATPPPAPVQLSDPVVPPAQLCASPRPDTKPSESPSQSEPQPALAEVQPTRPEVQPAQPEVQFTQPEVQATKVLSTSDKCTLRQELGLGQLKGKLSRSKRLADLKAQLAKVNQGHERLAQLFTETPRLAKFDHIDLQVTSPMKVANSVMSAVAASPLRSPAKESVSKLREAVFRSSARPSPSKVPYVSPRKLLEEKRGGSASTLMSGSYERHAWLAAASGKPCLPLPYSYKLLGEMFRAVEIVASMLYNRDESITFEKLKQSTQQLTSRRLSHHHLGQMLTVYPNAFTLAYEKMPANSNNYQLVIRPSFPSGEGGKVEEKVTPGMQLDRRREFFAALLEVTKTHHERFLLSLDPPLVVPRDKLTRWHPGFVLDSCPDVEPAPLPEQPVQDTAASAKHLLNKAKELFIMNPRMEKALAELSKSEPQPEKPSTSASSAVPALTKALKNIPKALLEKVRARQAAKAIEFLTKDPEKSKREVELARLPQMTRILRNLYVTEKKNVLDRPFLLDKLTSSYPENLPPKEMDHHLQLLIDMVPGWLTVHKYGLMDYIRLDKGVQLSSVIEAIQRAGTAKA